MRPWQDLAGSRGLAALLQGDARLRVLCGPPRAPALARVDPGAWVQGSQLLGLEVGVERLLGLCETLWKA